MTDEAKKVDVQHEGGENEVEVNKVPDQGEQGADGVDEAKANAEEDKAEESASEEPVEGDVA